MINLKLIPFLTRLSKKEIIILFVAVLFILAAVLDRLILSPLLSNTKLLDSKILSQEGFIKKSLIILDQKTKITDEINKYEPYLGQEQSEEIEIAFFLKIIEFVAEKHSIYLVDIKPSGVKEVGISKKYFLDLNLEARMEQIFDFFYAIENSDELLTVETFNIRPKAEGSNIATCNVSISRMVVPK